MNTALKVFIAKKNHRYAIPSKSSRVCKNSFSNTRKYSIKVWEEEIEKKGTRLPLSNGLSAISWGYSLRKILLVHGCESRATQVSDFAEKFVEAGF
jgi:hypothetical protein